MTNSKCYAWSVCEDFRIDRIRACKTVAGQSCSKIQSSNNLYTLLSTLIPLRILFGPTKWPVSREWSLYSDLLPPGWSDLSESTSQNPIGQIIRSFTLVTVHGCRIQTISGRFPIMTVFTPTAYVLFVALWLSGPMRCTGRGEAHNAELLPNKLLGFVCIRQSDRTCIDFKTNVTKWLVHTSFSLWRSFAGRWANRS